MITKIKVIDDVVQCIDHSRYQAKRKPTSNCVTCWIKWLIENHFDFMTSIHDFEEVISVLNALGLDITIERKEDES